MQMIPLFSHTSARAVVAYREGVAITADRFVADVQRLSAALPPGRHVLNVCADRYRFTVGLAACLMTQRVSLLPSTHTPEVIRQLAAFAPDAFCLTDDARCDIELPRLVFPDTASGARPPWAIPAIPAGQLAAIVFTSGSTGMPLPYKKTWGNLARCVRDGAPRLGLLDGRIHTLIGTVPAQHMYGFESTVLLALLSGNAFSAERPFYPADIAAAVGAVPRPRALVTTPIHLRTLLASKVELPPLDLIVSATAPLATDLAVETEATFKSPLVEIYGSTETGQIATRRTAETMRWLLWPDVRLSVEADEVFAQGGHVEQRTAMCDVIETISDTEFLLHGRTADLVNVAGKRSSFGYLNAQLNAIPGVVDGAFFLREGASGSTGVSRLAALVVAPNLSLGVLTEHLRERIDAILMPRPLLVVGKLPRNATGKLPQQAMQNLADQLLRSGGMLTPLCISPDDPSFAGHFPRFPVLAGAILLDAALHAIEGDRGLDLRQWKIASTKFLDAVRPGDPLVLEHEPAATGSIRFTIRTADRKVATGTLSHVGTQDSP